jgi:hypothetical protein
MSSVQLLLFFDDSAIAIKAAVFPGTPVAAAVTNYEDDFTAPAQQKNTRT